MLNYIYRWYYALALLGCLLVIAAYFIVPLLEQLNRLHLRANEIRSQLAQQMVKPKKIIFNHEKIVSTWDTHDALSPLLTLAELHHLTLQTMQLIPMKNIALKKSMGVEMMMSGNFEQAILFLQNLDRAGFAAILLDFDFKQRENYPLEIRLMLLLDREAIPTKGRANQFSRSSYNPFCRNDKTIITDTEKIVPEDFALALLKMVGFVQRDITKIALLRLPTNHVITVALNDQVGKEHAKVIAIQSDRIVLQLRDHTQKILTLAE